jgi:signal peptidase I
MEPTIRQGDRIIADMKYYQSRDPKIHDTVILKKDDVWLIKRIIAAGGDIVVGKGGFIYVNGPMLSEPYSQHNGHRSG